MGDQVFVFCLDIIVGGGKIIGFHKFFSNRANIVAFQSFSGHDEKSPNDLDL